MVIANKEELEKIIETACENIKQKAKYISEDYAEQLREIEIKIIIAPDEVPIIEVKKEYCSITKY